MVITPDLPGGFKDARRYLRLIPEVNILIHVTNEILFKRKVIYSLTFVDLKNHIYICYNMYLKKYILHFYKSSDNTNYRSHNPPGLLTSYAPL